MSRRSRLALLRRIAVRGLLAAAAAGLLYVVWLDYRITRLFTDPSWQAPTHVYARPFELRPGIPVPARALEEELGRHGYRRDASGRPGTYERRGSRFDVMLRHARFADRERRPLRLRVVADADGIRSVEDASGRRLASARLEPQLIGSLHPVRGEDRIVVPLEDVPPLLTTTLKAVEDRNFDRHGGVDLKAILRAAWVNLRAGRVEQGGSTLTQQLVKSYFVGEPRTIWHKAREAVMAVSLELRFSKAQILTAYLNEIYLGQDGDRAIHGFGLASRFYFGKPLDELELPETALLVGIVRGPSYYNPRTQQERATVRRNVVLARLAGLGVIGAGQAATAAKAPLGVLPKRGRASYPGYFELVRRELVRDFGEAAAKRPALSVFTSLDPRAQEAGERVVAQELPRLDRRNRSKRALETAFIVTLPGKGEIIAVQGGRDARLPGFNRALDARRPIGSLVKPVVYLAALETGDYHAATILNDGPVEVRFTDGRFWRPQNFDRETLGPLPLVRALAESRNLPTVQLGLEVGLVPIARKFRALGLPRQPAQVPSLLLGAVEMTPLEVAQIYGVLANGGVRRPLRAIQAVVDRGGRRLGRAAAEARAAADPVAVYQLNRMLLEVMRRGTGRAGASRLPDDLTTAGKSGTSSDLRDSWFAGFSGSHLVVTWVGHDDNSTTGLTGSDGALPIWAGILGAVSERSWQAPLPEGLDEAWIDFTTGFVPDPGCGADEIQVALPRNVLLQHADDCYRGHDDGSIFDRFEDWWRQVTGL